MGFEWILLLAIVELVISYCVAKEFQHIAAEKGYNEGKYFWWTFFMFPVGALMVVALPNKRATAENPFQQSLYNYDGNQLPEL